jgi:ankyrin repeat protein
MRSASHNPDVVRLLLGQEGIDVNQQKVDSGRTALCEAAYLGHVEAAKLILEREDIDINLPDNDGQTALFWACNNNCLEMVNLLLERDDIDPNPRAINWGCTLLAHACRAGGSIAIVRWLLSHSRYEHMHVNKPILMTLQ